MIALKGATKIEKGTCGKAATVAGVIVHMGDWVVGDSDGVVIIPKDALEATLKAGTAREEKEQGFFADLKNGSTTVELLSLDTEKVTLEG
jgi:4-hydroxy-4-methyl-2-oxoglutarate aldolase